MIKKSVQCKNGNLAVDCLLNSNRKIGSYSFQLFKFNPGLSIPILLSCKLRSTVRLVKNDYQICYK